MSSNDVSVVLVHGAWADGSSWAKVIAPLAADGVTVVAAQLPLTSLEEDVAAFAELSDFIDLPVRIYSAGMVVRLGFALATAIKPQILLMDEWFLAGDAAFMERARGRLEDMVRGAEILVLSSHMLAAVEEWCTRVLWMDQGRVRADGPRDAVLAAYRKSAATATVEVA